MRTITCKKCGQTYEIGLSANFIAICPQCKISIGCECEYGFGPITPCEIYAGSKEIAKITGGTPYRLDSDDLDIHAELEKGYTNLEVYKEATDIIIKAVGS